jgi:hypothetical protein
VLCRNPGSYGFHESRKIAVEKMCVCFIAESTKSRGGWLLKHQNLGRFRHEAFRTQQLSESHKVLRAKDATMFAKAVYSRMVFCVFSQLLCLVFEELIACALSRNTDKNWVQDF